MELHPSRDRKNNGASNLQCSSSWPCASVLYWAVLFYIVSRLLEELEHIMDQDVTLERGWGEYTNSSVEGQNRGKREEVMDMGE